MATYDEMINKLSPEQVRQMFNQGFPSELPKSMTLLDYISPSSYRDPRAADRFAPQNSATQTVTPELDENGFRQLSYEEGQRVYKDPRHDPNLSANAQYDKLFGGNQAVAPVANRGSMPSFNLSNLTNYIPSASTIGEYIPREIPNVFGVNNPLYAGLLGADQSQALSKQSNIAGLLGAAAALVQGMGRQGGRRSAAQNIISALGAGYGAAGQQYQQGLQMYGQTQQLALQQRQQAAIQAMKLKYPEYADEIDANPAGAFRLIAERETANKKGIVVDGNLVNPITGAVIFQANKPQARMLTNQEAADANLPYKEGQRYQVDASGKLDLVQGTAPSKENKPATSIEEFEYLQSKGGEKYKAFLASKAPKTTINNILPSDRAKLLSDNSAKYTANKPISEAFEIASRYDNFNKAFQNVKAGGASDAVLIYSVAKMLDPGGAVQQGDIETIAGRKSIPEKLQSFHQQFIDNRTLSDEQRENLNSMAYDIYKNKKKAIAPITKQYRNYAASMESPDPTADVQDPFQNIELPKQRSVTINGKKTQVRLGTDKEGNQGYFYTAPNGQIYSYKD